MLLTEKQECAFAYYMLHFYALRQGKNGDAISLLTKACEAGVDNNIYTNALSNLKLITNN